MFQSSVGHFEMSVSGADYFIFFNFWDWKVWDKKKHQTEFQHLLTQINYKARKRQHPPSFLTTSVELTECDTSASNCSMAAGWTGRLRCANVCECKHEAVKTSEVLRQEKDGGPVVLLGTNTVVMATRLSLTMSSSREVEQSVEVSQQFARKNSGWPRQPLVRPEWFLFFFFFFFF